MDEQNSGFILCDISFNGQLVPDVKLPKACSMGNIVQGLWLDDNFRKTGLAYLKAKDEEEAQKTDGESSTSLKCFRGIDRCILRAYVAIRIMPAWKWMEFKDFIVDFENKKDCYTVGDVLGSLCTGLHKPVLRIIPKNENEADDQEVKNIVNELLETRSLATLAAAECPLSTGMLSLIAQGKYTSTIGHDKCLAFIRWLRQQDLTKDTLVISTQPKVAAPKAKLPSLPLPTASKFSKPRITFAQSEIDQLKEWFNEDDRPSKEDMQRYTDILNIPRKAASIRLLALESIFFWFKNKRSKKKRDEASLLEPWEKNEERDGQGNGPSGETSVVPMETVAGDTPQVTMATGEGNLVMTQKCEDKSMQPNDSCISNGLASMLAGYTTTQDGNQSLVKPRKIAKSRVTYDPATELGNLNTWFNDNDRPEKDIIEEYTSILNATRLEKSKRLLSPDSVAMWFKNKRSKKRRSEGGLDFPLEINLSETNEQQMFEAVEEDKASIVSNNKSPAGLTTVTNANVASDTTTASGQKETENDSSEDLERNIFSAGLISVKTGTT